jgi:hypothetical protein
MRKYLVSALISGALLISSCANKYGTFACGNGMKMFRNTGFSFEFPERVKLKGRAGPDFSTFQLIDRGKILLGVYAGNDPSLFDDAKENKPDNSN